MPYLFFIFLSVLIFGHWFLFREFIRCFYLEDLRQKILLILALLFLSLGFFVVSMLSHYTEGPIVKFFYVIFSLWIGVFCQLVFWFLMLGVIRVLFAIFHFSLPSWMSFTPFLLVLIFTILGIINAHFGLKVKHFEIEQENIPKSLINKKIIHISDLHLGIIYNEKFLQRIIERINREKPDYLFITGDLFDGMGANEENYEKLLTPLKDFNNPESVFIVFGNHESYRNYNGAKKVVKKLGFNLLEDQKVIPEENLEILGGIYRRSVKNETMEGLLQKFSSNRKSFKVFLYHEPVKIEQVKKSSVNLMLTGHTHNGQIWPANFITHLLYKGYDAGFFREDNFTLSASSGVGTWGPYLKTTDYPEIIVIELFSK